MQLPNWQDPNKPPIQPMANQPGVAPPQGPQGLQGMTNQQLAPQQPYQPPAQTPQGLMQNAPYNPGQMQGVDPQSLISPIGYNPLELIKKHESGGQNVPNYMYDRTHTASGLYQITDTNWKSIAPRYGIDTGKYPTAMSAPEPMQDQVAAHMYNKGGFNDWAPYNPALKAAVDKAGGPAAFDRAAPMTPDPEYAKMSTDLGPAKEVGDGGEVKSVEEPQVAGLMQQPTDGTAIGDAGKTDEIESPLSKDKGFQDGLGMIAKGAKGPDVKAPQQVQNAFAGEMQGNPQQMGMMQSLVAKAMAANPKFASGLFSYTPPKRNA